MKKYQFDPNDFDLSKIVQIKKELNLATSGFETITGVCEDTLEYSGMATILSDTGNGKSNPLKYFARDRSNVYYIAVMRSMTAKKLFETVLATLGCENRYSQATVYNLIMSVGYYLNSFPSNSLLIFDEAGRSKNDILMHFHDLRNVLNDNVGIIFASPAYFKINLEKMIRDNIQGISEFYGRMDLWLEIDPPTIEEQAQFCLHRGVINEKVIEMVIKENQSFRKLANKLKNFGKMAIRYMKNKGPELK